MLQRLYHSIRTVASYSHVSLCSVSQRSHCLRNRPASPTALFPSTIGPSALRASPFVSCSVENNGDSSSDPLGQCRNSLLTAPGKAARRSRVGRKCRPPLATRLLSLLYSKQHSICFRRNGNRAVVRYLRQVTNISVYVGYCDVRCVSPL